MIDMAHRLWQNFYYGVLDRTSYIDLSVIPPTISLETHYDSKHKVYWVESPDLPDFEATGKTLEDLAEHVGDSLLVYLDIPHYFAKNYEDGTLTITDPRTGSTRNVTVSRKGVERVLA